MARKKTVIEEEYDTDSPRRARRSTWIKEMEEYDTGWIGLALLLVLILLWGVAGQNHVEKSGADCRFGIEDKICWFWDDPDGFDIDIDINTNGLAIPIYNEQKS